MDDFDMVYQGKIIGKKNFVFFNHTWIPLFCPLMVDGKCATKLANLKEV